MTSRSELSKRALALSAGAAPTRDDDPFGRSSVLNRHLGPKSVQVGFADIHFENSLDWDPALGHRVVHDHWGRLDQIELYVRRICATSELPWRLERRGIATRGDMPFELSRLFKRILRHNIRIWPADWRLSEHVEGFGLASQSIRLAENDIKFSPDHLCKDFNGTFACLENKLVRAVREVMNERSCRDRIRRREQLAQENLISATGMVDRVLQEHKRATIARIELWHGSGETKGAREHLKSVERLLAKIRRRNVSNGTQALLGYVRTLNWSPRKLHYTHLLLVLHSDIEMQLSCDLWKRLWLDETQGRGCFDQCIGRDWQYRCSGVGTIGVGDVEARRALYEVALTHLARTGEFYMAPIGIRRFQTSLGHCK